MRVYPFPDKTGSREELKRDILYEKIPAEDLDAISDRAWETGAAAAQSDVPLPKRKNLLPKRKDRARVC